MALSRRALAELMRHLDKHAGLELPAWVVESRGAARMKELNLDPLSYIALLGAPSGAKELDALVESVRVGETRFFRHVPHVQAVLEVVIPSWRERGIVSPRIWSAGCATGEEPYTLALVLSRALPPPHTPTILATDVSAEAIRTAKRGVYGKATLDHVPEEWQAGLTVSGTSVRVRPDIARLVIFEQSNLNNASQKAGAFDLIFCRNVLIYFAKEAQERVTRRLVEALAPGGFLFLGYSESLRDTPGLKPISWGDLVLYQKHDASRATQVVREAASLQEVAEAPVSKKPVSDRSSRAPRSRRAPRAPLGSQTIRLVNDDAPRLSSELSLALKAPGLVTLTIDLDGAPVIGDDVAGVLRRACAAGDARGITVELLSTRPGTKRWLRRHKLRGGDG